MPERINISVRDFEKILLEHTSKRVVFQKVLEKTFENGFKDQRRMFEKYFDLAEMTQRIFERYLEESPEDHERALILIRTYLNKIQELRKSGN